MNIKIKFPDGSVKEHPKDISPLEIAESISHGLAKQTVVAEVNGILVDLDHKIEEDAEIKLYKFDSKEGQEVYWHSTAHLLAQAVKALFPKVNVAIGPAIENGYYYDFDKEIPFTDKDLEKIEQKMKELSKEKSV
jgi:threonyl-tRNA synthetase